MTSVITVGGRRAEVAVVHGVLEELPEGELADVRDGVELDEVVGSRSSSAVPSIAVGTVAVVDDVAGGAAVETGVVVEGREVDRGIVDEGEDGGGFSAIGGEAVGLAGRELRVRGVEGIVAGVVPAGGHGQEEQRGQPKRGERPTRHAPLFRKCRAM